MRVFGPFFESAVCGEGAFVAGLVMAEPVEEHGVVPMQQLDAFLGSEVFIASLIVLDVFVSCCGSAVVLFLFIIIKLFVVIVCVIFLG